MAAPFAHPPAPSAAAAAPPSHPILISQGSRSKLTHQPKKNFTAHSCPNVRFQPPKAPAPRPRSPPCDPPPIELPPSPPIFSVEDVQTELDRQRNQHLQRAAAAAAPLSRSLTNNHFSYPRTFSFSSNQSTSFRPHFPSVSEEADHPVMDAPPRPLNLSESPPSSTAEFKAPHSYSDSSTIYSMMLRKNSLASGQPGLSSAPVMDSALPPAAAAASASSRPFGADDADLQFAISLDPQEDSSMLHGSVDSSSYTLNYRD